MGLFKKRRKQKKVRILETTSKGSHNSVNPAYEQWVKENNHLLQQNGFIIIPTPHYNMLLNAQKQPFTEFFKVFLYFLGCLAIIGSFWYVSASGYFKSEIATQNSCGNVTLSCPSVQIPSCPVQECNCEAQICDFPDKMEVQIKNST